MHEIANIDKFGRIVIPKSMRDMLGLEKSGTVFIEDRDNELIIKPVHKKSSDTIRKIAAMNLPVEDWETMEQEITDGALDD